MPIPADTPFVVFGDDWGRYPSTIQHTFRHIASRYPVVWVNGIGHRVPTLNMRDLKRAWEKVHKAFRQPSRISPVLLGTLGGSTPRVVIEPRILPWHQLGLVYRFNTWWLYHAITRRLKQLGLERAPILVTGSPPSVGLLGRLGELVSVYYCLDDFLNFPTYTTSMLAPLEHRLLERVDVVVATAASLVRTKSPRSGRAYHLPQGVNYSHFATPRSIPKDLATLPRPRIGFAGSVSTQCDRDLLAHVADAFPTGSLVMVGPVAPELATDELLRVPNVHALGVRSYEVLPAYVQHFDVGIIPYGLSAWTVAVDPLKLLEYLAAGLPVVTTDIPEVTKYAEYITVAGDADEFVSGIRKLLAGDREEMRARGQTLARQHTWERRAEKLLELIEETIQELGDSARPLGGPGSSAT